MTEDEMPIYEAPDFLHPTVTGPAEPPSTPPED